MNYAFTVTRSSDEFTSIENIESFDYNKVWLIWARLGIIIVYKYQHQDSESGKRHIHFHGMLTSFNKLEYSKCMVAGYSIIFDNMQIDKVVKGKKLTIQQHYDQVFNYCRHEDRKKALDQELRIQEVKEAVIYKKCMEAGQPLTQCKVVLKKADTLFKIEISGSI